MSRRRKILIISTIATLISTIIALSYFIWIPNYIHDRAIKYAERRFGLTLHINKVKLHTDGAELINVEVDDGSNGALRVSVDYLKVEIKWASLLNNHIELKQIQVGPGSVDVQVDESKLSSLFIKARRNSSPQSQSAENQNTRSWPSVILDGVELRIHDREGLLATTVFRSVQGGQGTIQLMTSLVIVGEESGDRIEAHDFEVELIRDGRIKIRKIFASAVDVRWATPLPDQGEEMGGRLVPRLRNAVSALRSSLRHADNTLNENDEENASWDRRLAIPFQSTIPKMSITGPALSGTDERFELTNIRINYNGQRRIQVAGHGQGARIGQASCNLMIEPDKGLAQGHASVTDVPLSIIAPLVEEIPFYPSELGRVSSEVELRIEGLDQIAINGSVEIKDAAFNHPKISSTPIRNVSMKLEGQAEIHPIDHHIAIHSGRLSFGEASLVWQGEIERTPQYYSAKGVLSLPPTSCNAALHAIPADVLGSLVDFELAGSLSGQMNIELDSRNLNQTKLDFDVNDGCSFIATPQEADINRFSVPFIHQAFEPDGTVFEMETGPGTPRWVSLYSMSRYIPEAVLAHEDASFFRHHGFAPWAIRDAVVRNLREGRYVVGASTITMQLAKNLFLKREKTLIRKVQEVILTWYLEHSLDKDHILELYLNVIEYGPGIYGIGAASQWWFGRSSGTLTAVEAAILALILPSPKSYSGMRNSGVLSANMKVRLIRFLQHMMSEGRLDAESFGFAREEIENFQFGGQSGVVVHPDEDEQEESDETESTGSFGGEHRTPSFDWGMH